MPLFGNKAQVSVHLDKSSYVPGERIRARVTVRALKDLQIEDGSIELEYVHRYVYRSGGSAGITNDNVTVARSGLLDDDNEALQAGRTLEQAVELLIPRSAPASGKGELTVVEWHVEVRLKLSQGSDIIERTKTTVLAPIWWGADRVDDEQLSNVGEHAMSLHVSSRHVRTGEVIHGSLNVRSAADLHAGEIRVELVRQERIQAVPHEYAGAREIVAKNLHLQANVPQEFRFSLATPGDACPSFSTEKSELWWGLRGVIARRLHSDQWVALPLNMYNAGPPDGDTGTSSMIRPRVQPAQVWELEGEGDSDERSLAGMAIDGQGRVYVSDSEGDCIYQSSAAGMPLTQLGEPGNEPGQFLYPQHLAVDTADDVYVADRYNQRIQRFSPWGDFRATYTDEDEEMLPEGVAVDAHGNVYALDAENAQVWKFSTEGTMLAVLREPQEIDESDDAQPAGIAVDAEGNLYVANQTQGCIEKVSPWGDTLAVWGRSGSEPGEFLLPTAIALDEYGNVYVADTGNDRVQKLSPTGAVLSVWGRSGWKPGSFRSPFGVAIGPKEQVYVLDAGNRRLQIFDQAALPNQGEADARW